MFSVYSILLVVVCFLICYGYRMAGWFSNFRAQKHLTNDKKNKFALFIPARDEGRAIIPLLESIKAQTYDASLIKTFIVVKNPEDSAYEYAKLVDAVVFCDPNQKCKGDCTDFSFKKLLNEYYDDFDSVIMIDADTTLESTFVEEMNNALASGAEIIIPKKRVRNYFVDGGKNSNLVTQANGLLWTAVDEMGSRFKADHGITVTTISNGILMTKKFIEEMGGWSYLQTFTEDMELERDCALRNVPTYYSSYAVVYTEEAVDLEMTNFRRTRWFSGLIHSDYLYFWKFLKGFNRRNAANIYMVYSMWFSFLYFACLFSMGTINLGSVIFKLAHTMTLDGYHLFCGALCFALIYFSFFVLVLCSLIAGRHDIRLSPLQALKVLFYAPVFDLYYYVIVVKGIVGKNDKEWVAVERIDNEPVELAVKEAVELD